LSRSRKRHPEEQNADYGQDQNEDEAEWKPLLHEVTSSGGPLQRALEQQLTSGAEQSFAAMGLRVNGSVAQTPQVGVLFIATIFEEAVYCLSRNDSIVFIKY
jgi:hypothetical protein